MARDLSIGGDGTSTKEVVAVKLIVDYIILITKAKVKKDDIKYLQLHIHKSASGRNTINEESSERVYPQNTDDNEFKFDFSKEECFLLNFRSDILPEVDQYEVRIQIMTKLERKIIGQFGICSEDVQQHNNDKKKLKNLKSMLKEIQDIDIKYKICLSNTQQNQSSQNSETLPNVPETVIEEPSPTCLSEEVDTGPLPHFRPNSCVIVLGTTGRGKTTTMNLYTGNTADTGDTSHSTTRVNSIYHDHRVGHEQFPVWLDTVGLDEAGADTNNSDLVRSYLRMLHSTRIEWVHAIVWCIAPEEKKLNYLKEQAEVIKLFAEKSNNIWKNVIIIAKEGNSKNHDRNFKGAKAAISELVGGHQNIVNSVQCLEYELEFHKEETLLLARRLINRAFCNIKQPIRVVFSNQVCLDCGQKGDERLLDDYCHADTKEVARKFLPNKKVCSHCENNWSRKIFGIWSYTDGDRCVRIRNKNDIKDNETYFKKCHNMAKQEPIFHSFNCLHPHYEDVD